MQEYLVLVGAGVNLLAGYSYIKDTIKGSTKPNRISWLMWTIGPFIATAAAISNGVTWAVLPVFISGFIPFLVLSASFVNKKSYWKLTKFDYLCGFFSILAIVLWALTKEPNIAIIFSILSDGSAAIPTLIKTYKHPQTETLSVYLAGVFNTLTTFAAVKTWNFSSLAFPIYLFFINGLLAAIGYRENFKEFTGKFSLFR